MSTNNFETANNFDVENITLESNIGAESKQFCSIWPSAKTALNLLQKIILNPVAKAAIGVVTKAGDVVASKICK